MPGEAKEDRAEFVRQCEWIVNHLNHSPYDSSRRGRPPNRGTYARRVQLQNVADYEAAAAKSLDAGAYGYYAGGAGDEVTLRDNVEAYGRLQLRPRVLVDVDGASAATTVL